MEEEHHSITGILIKQGRRREQREERAFTKGSAAPIFQINDTTYNSAKDREKSQKFLKRRFEPFIRRCYQRENADCG